MKQPITEMAIQTPVVPERTGASLAIEGVSKRYADQAAVDGVSLDIFAGEFMTFLGPSGSGKTTTLNLIAGFAEADAGRILLNGRDIGHVPAHRRNIGMVFQNYALFPHMTAMENVEFPLRQRKIQKRERQAQAVEALELAHMEKYANRYPHELSGGQQQRVAVARAIVFRPAVLLMDEPLGALDKNLRSALQVEIKRLHRELGITFIYVTHDQEEALVLSDRIALFDRGQIAQVGTAIDLYERPTSRFVAGFLGESNLLTGRMERRGSESWLEFEGEHLRIAATPDLPQGTAACLALRPEALSLHATAPDDRHERNVIGGTVEETVYLGNSTRVLVRSLGGALISATAPRGEPGFEIGERVAVSWSIGSGVVLPEEA